jgi:hypothetical protein
MHRIWIWMIPLLAAICAFCLQAAVHGYDPNGFTLRPAAPSVRPQATDAPPITSGYTGNMANFSLHSAEPSR